MHLTEYSPNGFSNSRLYVAIIAQKTLIVSWNKDIYSMNKFSRKYITFSEPYKDVLSYLAARINESIKLMNK